MAEKTKISGLLIVGGLLIGIGIGLLTTRVAASTLVGLGVGFIAAFIYRAVKKKK